MPIIVEPYNPQWPCQFEQLRSELVDALQPLPIHSIEHVGSTAVPGLAAKPILDVDIVVDRDQVRPAIRALEVSLGYRNDGTKGIPDRWALRWPGAAPPRNLYVTVEGCQALRNHLAVRDVLRSDAALRDEYARVKRALAAATEDVDEYVQGKSGCLAAILERAGFTEGERDEIRHLNRKPDMVETEHGNVNSSSRGK